MGVLVPALAAGAGLTGCASRGDVQMVQGEVALLRAEVELDQDPAAARARLAALAEEAREKGLVEVASRAERRASEARTAQAAR
jgi:hypothetical protein